MYCTVLHCTVLYLAVLTVCTVLLRYLLYCYQVDLSRHNLSQLTLRVVPRPEDALAVVAGFDFDSLLDSSVLEFGIRETILEVRPGSPGTLRLEQLPGGLCWGCAAGAPRVHSLGIMGDPLPLSLPLLLTLTLTLTLLLPVVLPAMLPVTRAHDLQWISSLKPLAADNGAAAPSTRTDLPFPDARAQPCSRAPSAGSRACRRRRAPRGARSTCWPWSSSTRGPTSSTRSPARAPSASCAGRACPGTPLG